MQGIRFIAITVALSVWFIFTGDKVWMKFAGTVVIFGINELVRHYIERKNNEQA